MLQRVKDHFTVSQLNTLYYSFVQPVIDYALSIWGHTTASNIVRVQRLQNRAARIVANNFNYEVSSSQIVHQLQWQNVSERRDLLTGIIMYKCTTGNAPNYLTDHFVYASDVHDHHTRQVSAEALHVPFAHTQYYQRSLAVAGPTLWNALPEHIRHSQSLPTFKYQYKRYLLTS